MKIKKSAKKDRRGRKRNRKSKNDIYNQTLDKTQEIALYYGFMPVAPIQITKNDLQKAKIVAEGNLKTKAPECTLSICPEEKIAVLRHYDENGMHTLPHPIMISYRGEMTGSGNKRKGQKRYSIGLEILGTDKSIAEAILIKTTLEILKEEGYKDLYVNINSIGDKDSIVKFARELTVYYRKNLNQLPAHCRQLFKRDVFELLDCKNEKCRVIKEDAPKSISFLSEASRQHFKEVLEYLEMLEIPYRINNFLIGNKSFCTQTLFEIRSSSIDANEDGQPLAIGVRYNNLAKRLGFKRELFGIGVRIEYKPNGLKKQKHVKVRAPKIYFVQIGFEAKLKSLKVVEILRQSKIPVYQALSRDKLTSQLSLAENVHIPYTILMGQKEALEDSVIVRSMANRSQETVSIKELPDYLKRLK